MVNIVYGYMFQLDKGEMVIGGGIDSYNNYIQCGSFYYIEEIVCVLVEIFLMVSCLKMLCQWGGIVDMIGDWFLIILKILVDGVFVNCGWGIGGFKVILGFGWVMVELMVKGYSLLVEEFDMYWFCEGKFIDESVVVGVVY